jgi:rhodanese-related sulfurtransferase
MKKSVKNLLNDANQSVKTYDVTRAIELVKKEDVLFVDVRDKNELLEDGKIPGAIHASRGLLEFYIDPESPYHKKELASDKEIIFYCKSSGRSALAAQVAQEMGLKKVAHVGGGFVSWKQQGGPVESVPEK